jgi:hypothetical protein
MIQSVFLFNSFSHKKGPGKRALYKYKNLQFILLLFLLWQGFQLMCLLFSLHHLNGGFS